MQSPLEVLGVPKALVARERSGDLDKILALAEAFYKALSRMYHPDRPDGDAELFAAFTEAIDELRNPTGLAFHAGMYVGAEDVARVTWEESRRARVAYDDIRMRAIVGALWGVGQQSLFGVNRPTSLILALGMDQLQAFEGVSGRQLERKAASGTVILEVHGDGLDELTVYRSFHPVEDGIDSPELMTAQPEYDPQRNRWHDGIGNIPVLHDRPIRQPGDIRAIGGATRAQLELVVCSLHRSEDAATKLAVAAVLAKGHPPLEWTPLNHAWWLSAIKPSVDVAAGDFVILMMMGDEEPLFALVGPVRAAAQLAG